MELQVPIETFLAQLDAGKITITPAKDEAEFATWTREKYDDFGNRLPDVVYSVPTKEEAADHIAHLQLGLDRTLAEVTRLENEIANAQKFAAMYDKEFISASASEAAIT